MDDGHTPQHSGVEDRAKEQDSDTSAPRLDQEYSEVRHPRSEKARTKKKGTRSVWGQLEDSFYCTAAVLRSVFFFKTNTSDSRGSEMQRANRVLDDLDRFFEPTLGPRESAVTDEEYERGKKEDRR